MPTRREISAARRRAHHRRRINAEPTALARLHKTCEWLAAEARRAGRVEDVTAAVENLVERVRGRLPLPDAPHEGATTRSEHPAPHRLEDVA